MSCLIALSCRGTKSIPRHDTALDLCIADAYKGTDRRNPNPPPDVVAAARACVAKYVKLPQMDRWATRLPKSVDIQELRKGDDTFVRQLVQCAAAHGISVDIATNENGSRRIEARSASAPGGLRSTDPAFLECARAGEKAERTFLAQRAQQPL